MRIKSRGMRLLTLQLCLLTILAFILVQPSLANEKSSPANEYLQYRGRAAYIAEEAAAEKDGPTEATIPPPNWSWNNRNMSNTPTDSRAPSVAVDSSTNCHIVWTEGAAGDSNILYDKWDANGHCLINNEKLPSLGAPDSPSIAADRYGNLHLTWVELGSGDPHDEYVYYEKLDAQGKLIIPPTPIAMAEDISAATPANIATDNYGGAHVVVDMFTLDGGWPSSSKLYYVYIKSSGEIAYADFLNHPGDWSYDASIAVKGDFVHIAWEWSNPEVREPSEIYYIKFKIQEPENPLEIINVSNTNFQRMNLGPLDIAVDEEGDVYVAWNDWSWWVPGAENRNQLMLQRVGSLHPAMQVTCRNSYYMMSVSINAMGGSIYLSWGTGDAGEIAYTLVSWPTDISPRILENRNISNNSGHSWGADIAVRSKKMVGDLPIHVYIVWEDTTPGNWEILAEKFNYS